MEDYAAYARTARLMTSVHARSSVRCAPRQNVKGLGLIALNLAAARGSQCAGTFKCSLTYKCSILDLLITQLPPGIDRHIARPM